MESRRKKKRLFSLTFAWTNTYLHTKISNIEPQPRKLRTRPSIADESGGEEILYPRNTIGPFFDLSSLKLNSDDQTPKVARLPDPPLSNSDPSLSPPSAFNQVSRRARKRTSDEFEFDQSGSLVSKSSGSGSKAKDDKMTTRRHRSLNVSISSAKDIKGKDRRRDSATLTISSNVKISSAGGKTLERDVKQLSAGSTSSNVSDSHHPRRGHATDYSHLPPSPSSSSIQHFLRHSGGTAPSQPSLPHSSSKDNLQSHPPPSVAHSLLRGTQEGWSALDDEALRKLDGLTGKGARARASVGSFGRPSSSSRPGTPASKSGSQWEGLSTSDSGKSKRASGSAKDNASIKDKIEHGRAVATSDPQGTEEPSGWTAPSSDEQQSHSVVPDTTPKKSNSASARLSFTPKRGSTSSTTYTSTPSSRDSAFMSAATSVTSMSAASGRHSSSKGRRNSASSDISVHSFDVKDRVTFLAVNGDPVEDGVVPPVPPLPKDLSTYRSPPVTSSALVFPSIPPDDKVGNNDSQLNRTISLEVPNYLSPPPSSSSHRETQQYPLNSVNVSVPVAPKTPSKKWSFSSALNLKISSSPSSASSQKSAFPLSPRSVTFGQQLRKSTSKDKPMSSSSSKGPWSPKQPDAMASAGSLVSLSSVGSVKIPAQATKTPERNTVSSRPGTGSSVSTNHTTSALAAPPGRLSPTASVRRSQSKRLTPSSIPFFRRSSSQSMQLPVPPANGTTSATSPTLLSMLSTSGLKQRTSPSLDYTSPSVSTPGTSHKKHSVLSLGLPSLLKSSSRRSLHSDAKDAAKEAQKAKDAARELEKGRNKLEKERQKKEDKERSESRISMIMNRKRGKVYEIRLSSVRIIDAIPFPDFIFD